MSNINVQLIDSMGSDLTVVNAARVSFDKMSEWVVDCSKCVGDGPCRNCPQEGGSLSDRDTKLIKYLTDHNHWSPFSHPQVQFRVAAPVFVARQLQKHTVGLAWNEVSRRYVDTEPTFYVPEVWRKRAENVKQGSSEDVVHSYQIIYEGSRCTTVPNDEYLDAVELALKVYHDMLNGGVCPEQARMVLPQSMMTEWIWTGSLYAFARVCNLRLDSHTQKETQQVAKSISAEMANLFPISWKALVNDNQ